MRSLRLFLLILALSVSAGASKSNLPYIGIMVGWEQVAKPNRLAGALRGGLLGAALTPPPSTEPSGAGDGISRTAQGTIAAQRAGEQMPYPTRSVAVYSFHSGYYVLRASMSARKNPLIRTGEAVRFRLRNHTFYLTDDVGKTFKLKLVEIQPVGTPYLPASGTGIAFSSPVGGSE